MSEKEGKYMMQAEEFINIACNSGYATKMNAKKYTEKHTKHQKEEIMHAMAGQR